MSPAQISAELERLLHRARARRRLARRVLRPLPRRGNLSRYPILKYFAGQARRYPFLWAYGSREVRPALYVGAIVTLMPLVGLQFLISFVLCVWLRGNFSIAAALQLVSNPLTAVPIYAGTYALGAWPLEFFSPGLPASLRIPIAMVVGSVLGGLMLAGVLDVLWHRYARRRAADTQHLAQLRNRLPTFPD